MRKLSANKGAVLILTFIIMVTLTAITTGFLFMTSTQLRGSAYDVASSKALWIAEAGLQQAIYQIKNDSDYRDSPAAINENLGDGSFSVSVSEDGNAYTITSTGTVDTLNRKVTQSMDIAIAFSSAFDYVLFGNTNSSELDIEDEVAISGDVYYDGDVEVKEKLTLAINKFLDPIRTRRAKYQGEAKLIDEIITSGSHRAQAEAQKTLKQMLQAMGLN